MSQCESNEIALKSFFLGPQAENQDWVYRQMNIIFQSWFEWRQNFRPEDGVAISVQDMHDSEYLKRVARTGELLKELTHRFENEIPKFSPRYIGHMFSEISLPALFGHILTVLHNPNNISHESSIVGTALENEAIDALGVMLGMKNTIGHFTSGGTIANFEAVYRARARLFDWLAIGLTSGQKNCFEAASMGWERFADLKKSADPREVNKWNPLENEPFTVAKKISELTQRDFLSPVLLVPEHKHYSWVKAAHLFGLGGEAIWPVSLTSEGRLDVQDLQMQIEKLALQDRPLLMVVSVLGTTELGMVDSINEVQDLLDDYALKKGWYIWHHVDAAYGGFLCTLRGEDKSIEGLFSPATVSALNSVARASSVTLDPHKLGYVPYACGAILCRDRKDYFQRPFGGPYVDFHQDQDKGPFTIEGSRSAAGAVATWMTAKCVGLDQQGYGSILARTIRLRQEFESRLQTVEDLHLAPHADTNLLGFCLGKKGESLKRTNERTLALHHLFNDAKSDFFVSKTVLSRKNYTRYFDSFTSSWQAETDCDQVALIRLCIMNPFFKTTEMSDSMMDLFIKSLKEKALRIW